VFQIVVFPGDEASAVVESFRRSRDPAFHEIGAHVVLQPPFHDDDAAALAARFDAFEAPGSLDVSFGAPLARGRALCLPVLDPDGRVGALVRALGNAVLPLSARVRELTEGPALRLGLFASDHELELARRAWLATTPRPNGFRASELVLLFDDVRGLWHEVARVRVR
jgi:hypothetical protein